jgi:hypothetical protein
MLDLFARMKSARKSTCHDKLGDYEEYPPVGIPLHSYRNCSLDVWRFSTTRHYHICHRSSRLADRVGHTLDFKLYHYQADWRSWCHRSPIVDDTLAASTHRLLAAQSWLFLRNLFGLSLWHADSPTEQKLAQKPHN